MPTIEQVIKKGSIVQSRQHGWQGIVTSVSNSLWESGQPVENIRHFMASRAVTEEQAAERWVFASDFSYMSFASPESDLFIISSEAVRYLECPSGFTAEIISVTPLEGKLTLLVKTTPAMMPVTGGIDHTDVFEIINPTVVPFVGDKLVGTPDVAIIIAEGLAYPYRIIDKQLEQDW